jgi:hypothetical protein
MSSDKKTHAVVNRRSFLHHSLSAAGAIAAAGAGVDGLSASSQPGPQPSPPAQPPAGSVCKSLDHKFATLTLSGKRDFGNEETPEGQMTLVVHFFGLVAFAKRDRFFGQDPMRVLLPKTPDTKEDHHDARLWALQNVSSGTGATPLGDFNYWNLYENGGTRIELEKPEGCRKKEGKRRNHPWEDFKFVSNLKELFPQGKFHDDDELRGGAGNKVVTYFGLPRGTLISGVPWSFLGTNAIWKYTEKTALTPRSLTDNVSYFRTLPKGTTEITLDLHNMSDGKIRSTVTIKPRPDQRVITCAITHAMPTVCPSPADPSKLAADLGTHGKDTNHHSRFYYQLFENERESVKPLPTFARGVRGEPDFSTVATQSIPLIKANRALGLDSETQPSTDEGHCECAAWF